MIHFDTGRDRHLLLRMLVTTRIALRQQDPIRQPSSDLADMDDMLEQIAPDDFELEIYMDKACWSLGLDHLRLPRRKSTKK
jgi:hypothetical protein